ncbi:MAG TPA: methyltransferase domain-containing protein [Bryobacteraceae bacterium]|nr:methyltransferase domain-containing protein [Bryobacteraceae bacterium]
MVSFACNICGRFNQVENFRTEPASCACGSNVRLRALIHLLSLELFGESLPLVKFPRLKSIRGLGMSDQQSYAAVLAEKFDYTNTFYDREPRMDFTTAHPQLYGVYDFVLSADVLEHIAPPVERALDEVCRLLKPHGFLGITVFCNPSDNLREHFPNLHTYRTVALGDSTVLVNRRKDGGLEVHDNLVFHGGSGATLEMREFGSTSLKQKLLGSGFRDVHFLTEDVPDYGVLFDADVSQPLIARKEPFMFDRSIARELTDQNLAVESDLERVRQECDTLRARIKMAAESRWVRLGRKFGLGPDFS